MENGSDDVERRCCANEESNSSALCSVVAAADESVDAALAATSDADESDSVRFVELVVLMNEESCFVASKLFAVRNEGT
jgi:hypothetical protein